MSIFDKIICVCTSNDRVNVWATPFYGFYLQGKHYVEFVLTLKYLDVNLLFNSYF